MLSTHDLNWFVEFDALKSVYFKTLGNLILGIEHVGSTAVPELLAKPTLDIDLVMCDYSVFDEIVAGLGSLGYRHMGDQGIYQREVFKPSGSVAPNVPRSSGWMHHHLYVCPALGKELHRHIKFRDTLRTSADLRREYATIKKNIASRADGDRRKYAEIKESECGEFFERVLKQAELNSTTF
nr:GrpB family protein [Armatimonas sp.]